MNKLKFHIVGLTHSDVKNHEVEYAKQALGKTICLVPDDDNVCDLIAVRAYDEDDVAVGFVGALEARCMMTGNMTTGTTRVLSLPSISWPDSVPAPECSKI